jgi:ribonuclease BN (tRNA processing enzyme)
MRFTVLGSGTTVPDKDRGPAGFLLQRDGAQVLIDGGGGTIQRLARAGVDARDLDGGVYSHRHIDHCGELVPLLFTLRVGADKPRQRDYPIWAGEGFERFLAQLKAVYPGWLEGRLWSPRVTELPLDGPGEALLPGGVTLRTLPANHAAGALHLRFESPEGGSLVFSGDTGPSEHLITLSRGADVLVTECAVEPNDPYGGHLCAEDIAQVVREARPKRVLLTHFYPGVDVARALGLIAAEGVDVRRAEDGDWVEV